MFYCYISEDTNKKYGQKSCGYKHCSCVHSAIVDEYDHAKFSNYNLLVMCFMDMDKKYVFQIIYCDIHFD